MKEIIMKDEDFLHLELIEALALLTAETISNDFDAGEMVIQKINSNYGSFKYTISCEKIKEKSSIFDKIRGVI